MKRLLITGANKNQSTRLFYVNQALKVIPSHYSLFNCLVDMGWRVDQRRVEIGEDLKEYDVVIVFLTGPRQFVAVSYFEALWAISQRPDCILAVDDWQVESIVGSIAKTADETEMFDPHILNLNRRTASELRPHLARWQHAVELIGAMQNRMLVSAFQTGHIKHPGTYGPELIFEDYPLDRLFVYNPNPYHRNRMWEDASHVGNESPGWVGTPPIPTSRPAKERRFNFASLVQSKTAKWLQTQSFVQDNIDDEVGEIGTWRVDLYGSKGDNSQKRLTEDEMVKVITRDWGCLMAGYDHSGSGWWRARPLQCAQAGSILIGDDKELRVYYGDDYPFHGMTGEHLTHCRDRLLGEVAEAQYAYLITNHPLSRKQQRLELGAVVDARR